MARSRVWGTDYPRTSTSSTRFDYEDADRGDHGGLSTASWRAGKVRAARGERDVRPTSSTTCRSWPSARASRPFSSRADPLQPALPRGRARDDPRVPAVWHGAHAVQPARVPGTCCRPTWGPPRPSARRPTPRCATSTTPLRPRTCPSSRARGRARRAPRRFPCRAVALAWHGGARRGGADRGLLPSPSAWDDAVCSARRGRSRRDEVAYLEEPLHRARARGPGGAPRREAPLRAPRTPTQPTSRGRDGRPRPGAQRRGRETWQ